MEKQKIITEELKSMRVIVSYIIAVKCSASKKVPIIRDAF